MIFDLEKNNNRDMCDLGDIEAYLFYLSNTNKHLCSVTIITIIATIRHIRAEFNRTSPKEKVAEAIDIPSALLDKEIARVYNNNLKLLKKKGKQEPEPIIIEESTEAVVEFTEEQLTQLNTLLNDKILDLKSFFAESLKKNGPKEETSPKKKNSTPKEAPST